LRADLQSSEDGRPVARNLLRLLAPWRGHVAVMSILVLAAAMFELVPPLIIRRVVDEHLLAGRPEGLLREALLYLGAVGAMQAITFVYGYLAATIAQRILSDLRVRLFAHVARLPMRYFDRVSMGDVISRCTAA